MEGEYSSSSSQDYQFWNKLEWTHLHYCMLLRKKWTLVDHTLNLTSSNWLNLSAIVVPVNESTGNIGYPLTNFNLPTQYLTSYAKTASFIPMGLRSPRLYNFPMHVAVTIKRKIVRSKKYVRNYRCLPVPKFVGILTFWINGTSLYHLVNQLACSFVACYGTCDKYLMGGALQIHLPWILLTHHDRNHNNTDKLLVITIYWLPVRIHRN